MNEKESFADENLTSQYKGILPMEAHSYPK